MALNKKNHIISEAVLISLIKKSPTEGIKILYDNYSYALKKQILRYVSTQENAEDVLQEVYIKAWKNFDKYDSNKGRLYTWMVNIAKNEAIDYLRSKKLENSKSVQSEFVDMDTYSKMNFKMVPEHIGIKELLNDLNPIEKKVMTLLFFGGYTQTEVSDTLQIPLGTIKTKTRKAYFHLRQKFNECHVY
jgi:RNA polymerase sigma factor (sigma-70 family)